MSSGNDQAMLKVDVYQGRAGLAAIAEDWRHLLGGLRNKRFFHRYGWWKSYMNTLDHDPDLVSFFVVRRGGQAVAILPLKRSMRKWCGLPVQQWDLPGHLHKPLDDILCDCSVNPTDIVAVLTRTLREHKLGGWDVLSFSSVLKESTLAEYATGTHSRVVAVLLKSCDCLACVGSYEDIAEKFSRNFRSNLNKARNKLAREQKVEFRSVTSQPELASSFAEFLEIEVSGWKGTKGTGTAIKLHPDLVQFYQSLIDELGPSGAVVINSLKVGDKPIASQFCVKDDDTLYVLKLAYDEDWSRVAPGNMLLEWVIQEGIRSKGFQGVNLVGDPPWFKDWQPDSQNVYNIWLFNRTPVGLALFGAMKAKQWLKPYYLKYLKRNRGSQNPARRRDVDDKVTGRPAGAGLSD
jgi:CelD/BcsL family acetyltransferase involved in cellulose biosynthesis